MSDKLVIEFYQDDAELPIATLLSFHGGDNPASGSLNLAAFLLEIGTRVGRLELDAGEIAARYILWQTRAVYDVTSSLESDVILMDATESHPYQVIRVRVSQRVVSLTIVEDRFSTSEEMDEAARTLTEASLPFEICALATR